MTKFAITLTKGNDERILGNYPTKDAAMEAGASFRNQYSRDSGLICCISAEFDETDSRNTCRLYEVW